MKSGEELRELFTSPNALFIGVCEGKVKSEEYSRVGESIIQGIEYPSSRRSGSISGRSRAIPSHSQAAR